RIIAAAFEAWAAGQPGNVFDLLAEDAVWTVVGQSVAAGTYTSKAEFLERVIQPFNARLATPLVPKVRALYADGDTVIAYFEATATTRDDRTYFNEYTWYLQLADGAVHRVVAFFDSLEFDDFWRRITPEPANPTA
ncbi:MAG: nuclear transport factor 2 family protein, partial [Pseudonocardia sp.]